MNKKPILSSTKLRSALLILMGLISTVGLIDAMYLTVTHYTQALVPCNFTHGCETVLQSSYSEILGLPIASLGIIFYVVALAAVVYFLQHKTYHWWLSVWGIIGFCSTLYLLYIQAFVLNAFCQYCLLSAATSTLIFILTTVLYWNNRLRGNKNNDQK